MSNGIKWTPEEKEKLHRLYPDQGPKAVVAATGRPYGSVKVIAHRAGLKSAVSRGRRRKFDPAIVVEVLQQCDWSPLKAARRLQCSKTTVNSARKFADDARKAAVRTRHAERDLRLATNLEGISA